MSSSIRHYAPHRNVTFEGYYSKFILPSGASLIVIICSVPNAQKNKHQLSFTYISANSKSIVRYEIWPEIFQRVPDSASNGFKIIVPGMGEMTCPDASTSQYSFKHPKCVFQAKTSHPRPWPGIGSAPEGLLAYLPLPLHWHVHSLASSVDFELDFPASSSLPESDRKGKAIVHEEKNWGHSFPTAHMWVQAWDPSTEHSICLAGGKILGMEAYLLGYRNPSCGLDLTFRPPLALSALLISPFMRTRRDWEHRCFELEIRGWTHKIRVKAQAPQDSFFGLSAPFYDGHRENYLAQSMAAQVNVEVWRRTGWLSWFGLGSWQKISERRFERAALEFGGSYYPLAGTKRNKNE